MILAIFRELHNCASFRKNIQVTKYNARIRKRNALTLKVPVTAIDALQHFETG